PLRDGPVVLPALPVARQDVVIDEARAEQFARAGARPEPRDGVAKRGRERREVAAGRRIALDGRGRLAPLLETPQARREGRGHGDVRVDVRRGLAVLEAGGLRAPGNGAAGARPVFGAPARAERGPDTGPV